MSSLEILRAGDECLRQADLATIVHFDFASLSFDINDSLTITVQY